MTTDISKAWIWLPHAAEVWGPDGPIAGRFVSVVTGRICDYGGNVLFSGTADECVAKRPTLRVPNDLIPLSWVPVTKFVGGADNWWGAISQ